MFRVGNIGDRDEDKLERMSVRFERVDDTSVSRATRGEERARYRLDGLDSVVSEPSWMG